MKRLIFYKIIKGGSNCGCIPCFKMGDYIQFMKIFNNFGYGVVKVIDYDNIDLLIADMKKVLKKIEKRS